MNRPPNSSVFGVSPISPKVAETPWDDRGTEQQSSTVPMEYPAVAIDLAPSLGQSMAVGRITPENAEPDRQPPLRLLPRLNDPEPFWKRSLYLLIACTFAGGFFFVLFSYWAPAPCRPGIDENGYLVGGRNFAVHGTSGFKPSDDYQFVGAMWVRTKAEKREPGFSKPAFLKRWLTVQTKEGWYYPKYPIGTSVLDAIGIWLGGTAYGREGAFLVSPVCAALAVLGMFFLTRAVAGSFYGLLAMIVLGTGQTMLDYSMKPNSHAPSVFLVVWGMYLIIRWWQTGRWWHGLAGGFLLGCAVTVRYTEALLLFPLFPLDQVLRDTDLSAKHPHWWQFVKIVRLLPIGPLGIAVILSLRWKSLRSYFHAAIPVVAWAVPVGGLLAFNWFAMGQLTGYDATNESQGFSTKEFLIKWDFTIQQLHLFGMFLILPLGVAGLIFIFRRSIRLGLLLTLWFLPGALLYNAYYWGNHIPGGAFLRFFLTLFPPLIVAAMWLMRSATVGATITDGNLPRRWRGSIATPIGAGVLTAAAASLGLWISIPDMEHQHRGNMNLAYSARRIMAKTNPKASSHISPDAATQMSGTVPIPNIDPSARPVFFADEGMLPQFLQYLQFMTDGDCYGTDGFDVRMAGGFGLFALGQKNQGKQDAPVLLQQDRIDYMSAFLKRKSVADLVDAQHQVIDTAIQNGRPVYAVLTPIQLIGFKRKFITAGYEMIELDHWSEPCSIAFVEKNPNDPPSPPKSETTVLAARLPNAEILIHWQPQELSLQQIRHKPAATKPTTMRTILPITSAGVR